jgi:hypothetical protein
MKSIKFENYVFFVLLWLVWDTKQHFRKPPGVMVMRHAYAITGLKRKYKQTHKQNSYKQSMHASLTCRPTVEPFQMRRHIHSIKVYCVQKKYSLLQHYLYKPHSKNKVYEISPENKRKWKHLQGDWRQIPAKRTNTKPTALLQTPAKRRLHHTVAHISCYRSCHCQYLISLFPHRTIGTFIQ